jgi:hypothetical protein
MNAPCPVDGALVEERINKVATEYREATNLLFIARTYIGEVEKIAQSACSLPEEFDLDTSVGEQLSFVGKRMGFGRCHCVCDVPAAFGFDCGIAPPRLPIRGFCAGVTWSDCRDPGISEVCIDDDELYRKFLYARRYQILGLYDRDSLTLALRHIYGPQAIIIAERPRKVVLAPMRELDRTELSVIQLVPRVLPLAYGIQARFHFGIRNPFGFGPGWGTWCEEWEPNGLTISTEDGSPIITATGAEITTGPLTQDSPWICEVDVFPYSCPR